MCIEGALICDMRLIMRQYSMCFTPHPHPPPKKFTLVFGVLLCMFLVVGFCTKKNNVIPPGIEPGTLSVLDSRDNHYTTESLCMTCALYSVYICYILHMWSKRAPVHSHCTYLQMARAVAAQLNTDHMLLQFFRPQL